MQSTNIWPPRFIIHHLFEPSAAAPAGRSPTAQAGGAAAGRGRCGRGRDRADDRGRMGGVVGNKWATAIRCWSTIVVVRMVFKNDLRMI